MADLSLPASPAADILAQRKPAPTADLSKIKTREQAKEVAQQFEHMFISEMLGPMFSGLTTEGPFGGGAGEEAFRPMLIDHYADAMSKSGGVGIANAVMKEILRLQGLE
jgi:Rod binding domain-containing protein